MRLTVTGGESSLSRTLTYNVSSVEASISAVNFNAADVYTGNVNFQYRCMGRGLQKTVYFYIDGDLYASEEIGTSHNETKTKLIEMMGNYEYGAHDLVVYFQTPDGAKSNEVRLPILYNDGTGTSPMIGTICMTDERRRLDCDPVCRKSSVDQREVCKRRRVYRRYGKRAEGRGNLLWQRGNGAKGKEAGSG